MIVEKLKCNLYIFGTSSTMEQKILNELNRYNGSLAITPFFDETAEQSMRRLKTNTENSIVLVRVEPGWEQWVTRIRSLPQFVQFIYLCKKDFDLVQIVNRGYGGESFIIFEEDERLDKQFQELLQKAERSILEKAQKEHYLICNSNQAERIVPWGEMIFIETIKDKRNFLYVHTENERWTTKGTLGQMRANLYPGFLGLKSYIINLQKIEKINSYDNYIQFQGNKRVYFSEKIIQKIKKEMKLLYKNYA
jgi:hypothetical protein